MFSICFFNIGLKLKLLIANMIGDRADVEPMLLFKIYKKVIWLLAQLSIAANKGYLIVEAVD